MRTMHLFAGHGGGLLSDLILGHTPVVAVEWDAYACKVLRERAAEGWFPELQVWEGDVRLFNPSEYAGSVDCIHAGFPCQDISAAGSQAGVGPETRSGLYREVLRIAGVVRPEYLFLENVSAIITNGLGTVLGDLAALGYACQWTCLRASDCGAAHHRDRWWLLAHAGQYRRGFGQDEHQSSRGSEAAPYAGSDGPQEPLADTPIMQRNGCHDNAGISMEGKQVSQFGDCCGEKDVGNSNSTQCQGNQCAQRINQEHSDLGGAGWWETEPSVGRVANGLAHQSHRLKGCGNGQVPLQAAAAFKILMDSL
jgi:DNA (cytosine-5)-methyltransferase 1